MDYGSSSGDPGRYYHPGNGTAQKLTWKDRKNVIKQIHEAIDCRDLNRALTLLDSLEDIIQRATGRDKENIPTPTADKLELVDHVRTLKLHADLLVLNSSRDRVDRLRGYIKKYYNELNRKENGYL